MMVSLACEYFDLLGIHPPTRPLPEYQVFLYCFFPFPFCLYLPLVVFKLCLVLRYSREPPWCVILLKIRHATYLVLACLNLVINVVPCGSGSDAQTDLAVLGDG
jgi:hypothetical protein